MRIRVNPSSRPAAALVAAVLCAVPVSAGAELLTVLPPQLAAMSGQSQGPSPLGFLGNGGSRTQNVYEARLFDDFAGPRLITGIDLRSVVGPFVTNLVMVSNVIINLSTTQRADEGNELSAAFADNIGDDMMTVFSGALALTSAAMPNTPVTPFDLSIVFQSPFLYDPTEGNLLIDVNVPVGASTRTGSFDTVNRLDDGIFSVFNGSNGNATTGFTGTSGPIIQVRSQPANNQGVAVAEPATIGLMAAGLLGLLGRRRRRASASD